MASIETVEIRKLKPWARNARTHSKKQVRQVADSIELVKHRDNPGDRRVAMLARDAGRPHSAVHAPPAGNGLAMAKSNGHGGESAEDHETVCEPAQPTSLKVLPKPPKRGRRRRTDGSCARLRPECREHVWSSDPRRCQWCSSQWRSHWQLLRTGGAPDGSMHCRTR